MVFLARVIRSAIRLRKLWTGIPSGVRPLVCLAMAAKRALHPGQRFIGAHDGGIIQGLGRQAGSDDGDAVPGCVVSDLSGFAGKGKAGIGDGQLEVPGHLVLVEDRPDPQADFGGATQRVGLAGDGPNDRRQIMLRSPTSTTWDRPKRGFSLAIWDATVSGSPVLPSNASTATGQPSDAHSRP